jgi:predicted transcriptional regulator
MKIEVKGSSWLVRYNYNNNEEQKVVVLPANRERIYEYIINNPGSHIRKISRHLDLAIGDTQHHLKILEKTGLIRSRQMGLFKLYYTVSIFAERQQSILAVLGQDVPRDIILFLVENPGASQSDIARYKGFSPSTINWHMSRLIEIGLIRSQREGRFVNYYVKGNIEDITNLLRTYYPSTWNKLSSRLAELFLDLSEASPPRLKGYKKKLKITPNHDNNKNEEDDNLNNRG